MANDNFAMPMPADAKACCNYRDAYGTVIFRILTMPDDSYIAQDKRSSLGFKAYEDAEKFMFTFNQ